MPDQETCDHEWQQDDFDALFQERCCLACGLLQVFDTDTKTWEDFE